MENAKDELLNIVQEIGEEITCAWVCKSWNFSSNDSCMRYIERLSHLDETDENVNILKTHYDEKEFLDFFNSLDFQYNHGYGSQNLFGVVWFADGSWLERDEYDGSEWWVHRTRPQIIDLCT